MESVPDSSVATEFRVLKAVLEEPAIPAMQASGPVSRGESEMSDITPGFFEHESVTGLPFVATYFKLDNIYRDIMVPDRANVAKVNAYVARRLEEDHLDGSSKAAISILREMEGVLSLSELQDPFYQLERMASYVTALAPDKSRNERKFLLSAQRNRDAVGRFV